MRLTDRPPASTNRHISGPVIDFKPPHPESEYSSPAPVPVPSGLRAPRRWSHGPVVRPVCAGSFSPCPLGAVSRPIRPTMGVWRSWWSFAGSPPVVAPGPGSVAVSRRSPAASWRAPCASAHSRVANARSRTAGLRHSAWYAVEYAKLDAGFNGSPEITVHNRARRGVTPVFSVSSSGRAGLGHF